MKNNKNTMQTKSMPEAELKALNHEACVLEMGEKDRKAYEEIRDLLDGQRHVKATAWYAVGRKVMKIMAASEYGKKSVAKIARALGRDASLLYDAGRVAKTWAPQRFAELVNKRDKVRGNRLSWSHFVELESIDGSGRRGLFLKQTLEEGLSVRDLKKEIAGPKPEEGSANDQATNVAKALRNFKAASETMVQNAPRWDASIFDVLDVQDKELLTPKMLQLLIDTRETLLEVRQTCEDQSARLGACIARSQELQVTSEDVATTPAEEEESRGRPQHSNVVVKEDTNG